MLRRMAQLWNELPARIAVTEIAWECAHKLLRPYAHVGYSQFAEDHLVKGFLDINQPGFYVDVGCNHPMINSNTIDFYLRGWRGLVIDANPACIAEFSRWRPRDVAIVAAISDVECDAMLTLEESTLMSSLSTDFVETMIPASRVKGVLPVRTRRLDQLMVNAGVPARFELLSIDIEGFDEAALRSFDLGKFRPQVILIELHGISLESASEHSIVKYLAQAGYAFGSLCRFTGIFIDMQGDGQVSIR